MSDNNEKSGLIRKLNIPSLVIGIIITFFVTKILEPILEVVYSSFLNFGGNFISSISDSTYQKISDGFSDQGTMFISYFLYFGACFLVNWLVSVIRKSYDENAKVVSDAEKSASDFLNSSVTNKSSSDTDIVTTLENLSDSVEKLSVQVEENQQILEENCQKVLEIAPRLKKRYRRNFITSSIVVLLLFIVFGFMYVRLTFINEKITVTTNNIEIVSPCLDYKEYQQLKSDFHSMQNKEDYESLQDKLNDIAKEHSLTLKE